MSTGRAGHRFQFAARKFLLQFHHARFGCLIRIADHEHGKFHQPAATAGDCGLHATLAQLEALFDASYVINRERPPTQGPAMGRYGGDVYYSGGAYYFSTLAAAEFCFRAAAQSEVERRKRCTGNRRLCRSIRCLVNAAMSCRRAAVRPSPNQLLT